jgi:hypothetical protein
VTWGSGTQGVSGVVSEVNSLVGSDPNDRVGNIATLLTNGNYVVESSNWNGSRGAVTWASGTTGVRGTISELNSLVGSNASDFVGRNGITVLSTGDYVVGSPNWNGNRGAVTWGSGTSGVRGVVSEANSLIGANPGERVGAVTTLSNGNYVVSSPLWNGQRGAATWGNGTEGISGIISTVNSLVGSDDLDRVGIGGIIPLSNGNYVVNSDAWNADRGAVTWADGTAGIRGPVSAANSLVGTIVFDEVGREGITTLSNGNYVVSSSGWNFTRGAVTWGSGMEGISGAVSVDNSLVGTNEEDRIGSDGVIPLPNGNYVVRSLQWNGRRGAVTWGNGAEGVRGPVSAVNSLVGSNAGDRVGSTGIVVLGNGNYLVRSLEWNTRRGAVTWGSATTGISGTVSDANSLVGSNANDQVVSVTLLSNGNYLVQSLFWNGNRGEVTWGNGTTGISGIVSAANSLVGSNANDVVGTGGITFLSNGNYLVRSAYWDGRRGALTWGSATEGVSGAVSDANSLVGSNPDDQVGTDQFGNYLITPLSNGDYLVRSPLWNGNRGAVTWVSGTTGQTVDRRGIITPQNSLEGRAANAGLAATLLGPNEQSFLATFATDGGGRVTVGLFNPNQLTYARAQAQTITITPDFLTHTLNTGTAVLLQASNDITIEDPIHVDAGGNGGALTLQAGRSILINASITTDNGAVTLIANDTLADGVADDQRDPGNAFITMAGGTVLDTGTGPLTIELRDGAGLTNNSSRAINLHAISAGSVTILNNGPSAGSDIRLETVITNGPQSYSNPHGITTVAGYLLAGGSPITFTDSVTVNAGVTVGFDGDTVDFAGSGTQMLQSASGSQFSNFTHTGSGTLRLTGGLNVIGSFIDAAGIFDANDQIVNVSGLAQITDGIYFAGTATQNFHGGLVVRGGIFTSSTGPMTVTGPIAVLNGILSGQGTIESLTDIGGTLAPNPGILSITGSATFFASTTFSATLNGADPGSYSQVSASGPVNLGGSTLDLTLGFVPQVGDAFTLLSSAFGTITGTFAGLDEGATFMQDGILFQITYQGGPDGHSVVLTRLAV